MPRPYNPDSTRNRPGVTIRPTAADRLLIAAWAKRWRCGLGEAAARLAVMGAEVGGSETAAGRAATVADWLSDGMDYIEALKLAQQRWDLTQDEVHRMVCLAMTGLPKPSGPIEYRQIRARQEMLHGLRCAIVYRFSSLAMAAQARRWGYRVIEHKGTLLDVVTDWESTPRDLLPVSPWSTGRKGIEVW